VNWLTVVLRIVHIGAGVFWMGSLFTVSNFVTPTAAALVPRGHASCAGSCCSRA